MVSHKRGPTGHIHTYDDGWKCVICGKTLSVVTDLETGYVHVSGFERRKAKYN